MNHKFLSAVVVLSFVMGSVSFAAGKSHRKGGSQSYQKAKKACLEQDAEMSKADLKQCIKQQKKK